MSNYLFIDHVMRLQVYVLWENWKLHITQKKSSFDTRHIFVVYSRTLKRLLLTDCTPNKILYRTTANLGIFVINAFILTIIKWQIVLNPFLTKSFVDHSDIPMSSYDVIFDTLAAYECLWECPFTFAHTKMFILSHPNCDHTGIRVL